MNISLNNIENANDLLTFNHNPTLLKVSNQMTKGRKKIIKIQVSALTRNLGEFEKMVENGVTVIGNYSIKYTVNHLKAVNNVAYLTTSQGASYYYGMAHYLASALKWSGMDVDYIIEYDENALVTITPREWGKEFDLDTSNTSFAFGNWSFTESYEYYGQSGSSNNDDELSNSSVFLNLKVEGENAVTLQKTYYKDSVSFDLSPILSNYTDYGEVINYDVNLSYLKNGQMFPIGKIEDNYACNGYYANDGKLFLDMSETSVAIGQNVDNSELYYINGEDIVLTLYSINEPISVTINEYDSARNLISTSSVTFNGNDIVNELRYTPQKDEGYYIDVVVSGIGTVTYNNIKPINYNEHYKVLYFHNSYGGTSFIPMTAGIENEIESEKDTYKNNCFGLYDTNNRRVDNIYRNSIDETYTLKSHYISGKGLKLFKDLIGSYSAWVEENGLKKYIIIDEVSFEEMQPNLYQVTVQYKMSLNNSF